MAYPHQVPNKLSKYFEHYNSIKKTSHNSCPKDFDDASMKTSYMGNKKNFGACPSKQRSMDQDKQFRNKKITIKYFLKPRKNMCTHLKHAKTQNTIASIVTLMDIQWRHVGSSILISIQKLKTKTKQTMTTQS